MKPETPQNTPVFLRLPDLRNRYRVAGSTIWKWAAKPETGFPAPVKLGLNTTAWRLADLLAWEASRPQVK